MRGVCEMARNRRTADGVAERVAAESDRVVAADVNEQHVAAIVHDLPHAMPRKCRHSTTPGEGGAARRQQQASGRLYRIVRDGNRRAEMADVGPDDAMRGFDDWKASGVQFSGEIHQMPQGLEHLLLELEVVGNRRLLTQDAFERGDRRGVA